MALLAARIGRSAHLDYSQAVTLVAATTANSNYCSLTSPNGTAYQVPAGKTLYIVSVIHGGSTAGAGCKYGYGDTSVANGAAAPTNPVELSAEIRNANAWESLTRDVVFQIPATKYAFIRQAAASGTDCAATVFGFVA